MLIVTACGESKHSPWSPGMGRLPLKKSLHFEKSLLQGALQPREGQEPGSREALHIHLWQERRMNPRMCVRMNGSSEN